MICGAEHLGCHASCTCFSSLSDSQTSNQAKLKTFLKTDTGYEVTAPEGFVAISSGNALKLVKRREFSRANFTAAKDWEKG